MAQAIRLNDSNEVEFITVEKSQYEKLQKEVKILRAKLRLGQEIQKGLLDSADGKEKTWEEVKAGLKHYG
ncbi:hypothetical protein SAMN02745116_02379 [Pilibacter termitis]|jgi:formiminotetrahydrofolate cyclodeaminase|uniref:Uncharacterized protein n=1 Tax=Pilibacter termitis TaxID=263852 RepID=A0A1T4QZR0_9ENTE|nr:hypothetical protein [Pilibacter termitis]SKA08941.1 hypothetical protein SAMN02745116_02379 [Pilibacter termitis]